jgi:hypothetical protein
MAPSIPTVHPLITPMRVAYGSSAIAALAVAASLWLLLQGPLDGGAALASAQPDAQACALLTGEQHTIDPQDELR